MEPQDESSKVEEVLDVGIEENLLGRCVDGQKPQKASASAEESRDDGDGR
jgi:hypothetical protein